MAKKSRGNDAKRNNFPRELKRTPFQGERPGRPQGQPEGRYRTYGEPQKAKGWYSPGAAPDTRYRSIDYQSLILPSASQNATYTPSKVREQPKKQDTKKDFTPASQSLSARDKDNKRCKARPDKLAPRKAGGGTSKRFALWCK